MNCNLAKTLSIIEFLEKNNIRPVKVYGDEFLYHSPLRKDSSPSFSVNVRKNVWRDSGRNQGGDLVLLVCLMYNVRASEALNIIGDKQLNPFSFSAKHNINEEPRVIIRHIQTLQNKALLQYLRGRLLSINIASKYLLEAYYEINNKKYFALAFKNDKGGYELRNKYFKGSTAPKSITTVPGDRESINIFEGVYDFLSALEYCNSAKLRNTTIILNSLSFINQTFSIIKEAKTLNLFLDNDIAGEKYVSEYKMRHNNVKDWSKSIYPNHKDFNDFLLNKPIKSQT